MTNKNFITITNKDLYKILINIKEENEKCHKEMILHQQFTNGKVKLNQWISTTALSLVVAIIFGLLSKVLL